MEYFFGVFENDPNNKLPLLERERTELEECLRPLEVSGDMAITLDDGIGLRVILDKLRDYQNVITVFHFSGHHLTDSIKTNDSELDDKDLITFLNNCPKLKLVVINGCSSGPILDQLTNVPIKIGTNEDVYDILAKEFAIQFYKNIFSGGSIDGIKNRENILESFDLSTGSAYNLLDDNAKAEASQKRGGGSLEELEKDTFRLSTSSDDDGKKFEERNSKIFDKDSVNINEEFEFVIEKNHEGRSLKESLRLGQAFQIYRHYPFNLSLALKKILSHDQEANGFNVQRFIATKNLFREYFNLVRVISLAAIWDSFLQEKTKDEDKDFICELLKTDHSEFSLEGYNEALQKIIDFIPADYINSKEDINGIFKNFKQEQSFLSRAVVFLDETPEHSGAAKEYHKIYKSSILVQGFIQRFSILRSLYFCSITKFEFKNYKTIHDNEFTFTALTYPIKTRPDSSKPKKLNVKDSEGSSNGVLDESKLDIKDQNSVYLMFKEDQKSSYLLNLSPFLFDANSEDDNSDLVDLNYILNYDEIECNDWTYDKIAKSGNAGWLEDLKGQELIKNELNLIVESFID